ncbi:MAG TPA: hypothetical protein VIC53_02315 [Wenzhouxiangella sp.]
MPSQFSRASMRFALLIGLSTFSAPALSTTATIFKDDFKAPQHHVMLRAVYVTEEWIPYDSLGAWDRAVTTKESKQLKYYEVAIWEETESVHLYAFDEDYDPFFADTKPTPSSEAIIAHREQYRIMRFDGLSPKIPGTINPERSIQLRDAFVAFAEEMVRRHPDSKHHLMYSGHGGPGGNLFEVQLLNVDAATFLGRWTETLGENLGVIDMGGPCNKSGLSDLNNFCRFADYYIASDLPNGGYAFDDWTLEKYNETSPELQYHRLFSDRSLSFEQALKGRIDLFQQRYEYARNHMINNQVEQANYLYSCQKWPQAQRQVEQALGDDHARTNGDLVEVLKQKGADQSTLNALEDAIIHQADNRTFFDWPAEYSGFIDW